MKLRGRRINAQKAATLSIVMNSIEVALLIGLLLLDVFTDDPQLMHFARPFSTIALVMLIIEGLTSVRDGFIWRKTNQQNEMMADAMDQLDDLNIQLRKQRHDFLNHLQVVYSLVDMKENDEAVRYIETVYGQMRRLSAGMKTDKPAVNALLQAKLAQAEDKGVRLQLEVTSPLTDLPVNDWELCRVLGNLIDNGMDAMEGMVHPEMKVELYEDLKSYGLRVSNNGPEIPAANRQRIFNTGFTTKAAGHGLGLSIVKEILEDAGGGISLESDAQRTAFTGWIPKVEQTGSAA
ncbi:MAG: Spo0B domain-containing protein [Candidatus Spyradocola sp.]|nr:Spo0B domain-containing protein [Candidatus Spyradocola sp.]